MAEIRARAGRKWQWRGRELNSKCHIRSELTGSAMLFTIRFCRPNSHEDSPPSQLVGGGKAPTPKPPTAAQVLVAASKFTMIPPPGREIFIAARLLELDKHPPLDDPPNCSNILVTNIFRNKAERPLLLLFPGCCNDTASVMRIRKGQARGGNASARGESQAPDALAATGTQDQQDVKADESLPVAERCHSTSAPEKCENVPERVVVRSEAAPPSWLAALQTSVNRSPTPPDRPYMNLDEFVNSLARKNCFPDEEFVNPYSDHHHKTGVSSGSLINFSGPSDDQFTSHFSRVDSGSSIKHADDVDTSLRLAISPREMAPAAVSAMRIKGGNIMDTENVVAGTSDDRRREYCTTTGREDRIWSPLEGGQTIIAHAEEECGQSYHMAQTTSILESTEVEVEEGQPDQTMKSSTEGLERRHRRASRSTGRKRGRLPSPAPTNEEQTNDADQEEEASSDYSSQRAKSRKRKRKKTLVSVSSSTLAAQDSEKKKQKQGLRGSGAGESASKRTKTKKERKTSHSRSGRPKRLKYMKQENTEELGNQCNRSDGKGWTCPLLAKTGYQLCDHHLDKLRCKPGSRSKYNKKKKGGITLS